MTIQIPSGLMPSDSSYTSTVNAPPTAATVFARAYARYLRLRADSFEAGAALSDQAMGELISTETQALLDAAAARVCTIEEFSLKLQLLQSEIEAHEGGRIASVLAACLAADLRHI